MKLFALKDADDAESSILAVLACYGGAQREYCIDMPAGTDPWAVPLILSSFAKRGRWAVGPEWSRRWVESRIVPPSRQNIGEVLRVNGLSSYDELALLEATRGRNSQDECYLEPLRADDAPAWFAEREGGRVVDAFPLEGARLLACFRDGMTRLYSEADLLALDGGIGRILSDGRLFERARVSPGGREVRWGTTVRLEDRDLRAAGTPVPLPWDDLARIAPAMLVDAAEAAGMLGCTRQNVNALMKRGSLAAAKASGKATMFLRADIRARADG